MPKGFYDDRYRELIGRLADERRKRGWRQEDLAQCLGMHQPFVSRFELGERRLDVVEFADVAAALGLDASELIKSISPRS